MIAAVFHGVAEGVRLEKVPVPEVKNPSDILVKVHRCGVCGSDLATLEGRNVVRAPLIIGHEIGGEVIEVGNEVRLLKPGDHVTMIPDLSCGVCLYCRSNRRNLCPNMVALGEHANGAFAEYLVAPESVIFKVPDDMPWDIIPLAEPLSCVVNGVVKTQLQPGENAVVYGAGPIGLLWLSLLRRSGAGTLISVEPREKRAEAARKVGADFVIDPTKVDPVAEVMRVTDGRGADVAAELVGRTDTIEFAIRSAAYGGRVIIMGTSKPDALACFAAYELMRYEKRIMGSYISNGNFQLAIDELAKGFIPADVIITHRLPIREIHLALELNKRGESIKTLILPGQD